MRTHIKVILILLTIVASFFRKYNWPFNLWEI